METNESPNTCSACQMTSNLRQRHEDARKALETINMLLSPTYAIDPANRERIYHLQDHFLQQLILTSDA